MKSLKRVLLGLVVSFAFVFMLVSCSGSKVSKAYADTINNSHQAGNDVTCEDAKTALGDECIEIKTGNTGKLIAIKGLTKDNYQEKLNSVSDDTRFEFISITVVTDKCTYAFYGSGTVGEIKAALR